MAEPKCTCPLGFVRETTGHMIGCPTLGREVYREKGSMEELRKRLDDALVKMRTLRDRVHAERDAFTRSGTLAAFRDCASWADYERAVAERDAAEEALGTELLKNDG